MPADVLWWSFLVTLLAVGVLVGALGIAAVIAQRRVADLHLAYARRLLGVQEEERARVAREVHDDAVQRLAMLYHEVQEFERAAADMRPEQRRHLHAIGGEVQDLSVALRQLAYRLHPAVIEHAGLPAALQQLTEEAEHATDVSVQLTLPDASIPLRPDQSLALFRIAQEGLRNAARHARARQVALTLRENKASVELSVTDDGCGFDPDARRATGIGLIGMEERARLAGGSAAIRSRHGEGTAIVVRIPRRAGDT